MHRLLAVVLCVFLAACSSSMKEYQAALDNPTPPEDFWLSVTVLGPARSAGYADLPRAERPGRYVIEADRILRASQGPGASEDAFPPQLRALSDEQWCRVWDTIRSTGIAREPGKLSISMAPRLEQAPEQTVIIISYSAEGVRRAIAVNLTADEGAKPGTAAAAEAEKADAKKIVDVLADLSWIHERVEAASN